jgi:hypothetical protein
MKKSIILLSFIAMTFASFKSVHPLDKADATAERMAHNVVTAFQHGSLEEYALLYPSVSYFHEIMEQNANFYGSNLEEAKKDFEVQYFRKLVPALNESFKSILAQGKKAGIEWQTIKLEGVEVEQEGPDRLCFVTFSSNGNQFRLAFEKTIFLNGEWKVTQYLKLI